MGPKKRAVADKLGQHTSGRQCGRYGKFCRTNVYNPLGPLPAEYWPPPALADTTANKPMALGQWLLTAKRQRGETRTVWDATPRARRDRLDPKGDHTRLHTGPTTRPACACSFRKASELCSRAVPGDSIVMQFATSRGSRRILSFTLPAYFTGGGISA